MVVVSGSDTTLDDNAYETIRLMGEVYGKEDRAEELTNYLNSVKDDRSSAPPVSPGGGQAHCLCGRCLL